MEKTWQMTPVQLYIKECSFDLALIDPIAISDGIQSNMKMKRAKAHGAKNKSILALYNKLTDLVGNLAELVDIQELTDTIILQMSTLAVAPFFVENISELQLNALKLVTRVRTTFVFRLSMPCSYE